MKNITATIIDKNPTTSELLKIQLEVYEKISEFQKFLDIKEGYNFIYNNKQDLVFLTLDYGEDIVFETVSKIKQNNPSCKIVLIGNEFNANLMIKAMKNGVDETLTRPFNKDNLDEFVMKLFNKINYKSEDVNSKIISIFSSKGGIGKTTIATNLALEIANLTKEPTVIIDLNSQFGDVATFLDIRNEIGISYLLKNKDKIDKNFLQTNLPKYKDTSLFVLSDLFYLNDMVEITLNDIQDIIDALRSSFSYVIIDMTNILDLKALRIFDNSDIILFPILANMPNLRNCQKCLDFFMKLKDDDKKVKLILNRYTQSDEIKSENIETTLQKSITAKIPNGYFTVMTAINRGIGISEVNDNAPAAKAMKELAILLTKKGE